MKTIILNCLFLLLVVAGTASAQTPLLNSYPSSSNVIFLDFDGHIVEGTSWNYSNSITCDGSNLNQAQITSIFHRVAEDYRPFTVNVTTDSTKYLAAPPERRMRVVLTTSSSWYGSAGGVAYINSFTWGDNTPCFVFTALLNYNAKNIAEAASHEIGHTLGLRHQSSYDAVCNKTSEYNPGKGTGEIGWAPIMGVGYYQNMTLWNYGANPYGCTAIQDDLSVITGNNNGISFRSDDHGNTTAQASAISLTNNSFAVDGIIESPNDIDAIKISISSPSSFKTAISPFAIAQGNTGSNIDLEVELLDKSKTVLGVYNSATSLDASIDTLLPAGVYYLRIQGKGNMYAPNYASLGSYSVSGSITPATTLPVHKLQLRGTANNRQHKLDWEIIADENAVTQVVETSAKGTSFHAAATLNGQARTHHQSALNKLTYYRVAVTFDNGRTQYSNVVALPDNSSKAAPNLLGNIVSGSMRISSPSVFTYDVMDISGRMVMKGTLMQGVNNVPLNVPANGVYLIRYSNGHELFTEKFSKQ